jgi:hypothetical protein
MFSNNVRHLITRTITTLQTLRYTSPHFTQLHFTALIDTSLLLIYTSLPYRHRVFDNRVFRRTFWLNTSEVSWCWRRIFTEEFQDVNSSTNIMRVIKSRRMKWAGHVARMGDKRGAFKILVRKTEVKRLLY